MPFHILGAVGAFLAHAGPAATHSAAMHAGANTAAALSSSSSVGAAGSAGAGAAGAAYDVSRAKQKEAKKINQARASGKKRDFNPLR
ncbi:hypothetical protein BT63DRAFT_430465 [Microthyrium microscopicum]|uniref:Uncharacterized protein n=1 Tax=Microthyrium microscopicum TaxID=703497 RepID=A0A6A6TWN4_9PEZI|nr:hypothetical protein BT63DRAFT_430465 [Microthyrium microscopicum]